MSKSEDNTNELESYGVWVKNTAQTPEDVADTQEKTEDSLDLPEFDNTDFSDMFKNDSEFETPDTQSAEINEDNMFANGEELSNDSATDEVILHDFPEDNDIIPEEADSAEEAAATEETFEAVEAPVFEDEAAEIIPGEEISEETFDIPVETEIQDENPLTEDTAESASVLEETEDKADASAFEGITEINTDNSSSASIDDLEINTEDVGSSADFEEISFDSIDEPASENAPKEEKTQLAPGEEEISLDDFLDEGFSDDSVASGNNGYEPGKGPDSEKPAASAPSSDGTEDISLDDFMDSEDFGVEMTETPAPQAEEETDDEPPLDMDLSFDDSTDTIETEDNKVSDDFSDFTADDTEDFEAEPETSAESEHEEETYVADTSNVSTEEVDLSDFGIDSDAEETPVTQNVEEKKAEETVVDYDLAIGDEDSLASAPVINEIKTEETEEEAAVEQPVQEQPVQPAQPDPQTTSLLQQIVAELSGLKNDINKLKSEIDEVKERNASSVSEMPVTDEASAELTVDTAGLSEEIPVEPEAEDEGGFFSGDEDETIALSADELTNIPIDTDSVIEAESEVPLEEPSVDIPDTASESVTEDSPLDESFEIPEETSDSGDSGFFTDEGDDTIALSGDELTNIMNTTEISESDGEAEEVPAEDTQVAEAPVFEDAPAADETIIEETSFDEPELSEPSEEIIEETSVDESESFDEPVTEPVVEPDPFEVEETAVSEDEVVTENFEEPALTEESAQEISVEAASEPTIEETVEETAEETSDNAEDLNFDFEDKNLEEPDIENIQLDDVSDQNLPEEISIPKEEDNIFVESTSSDFMDSINSVSEEADEVISDAPEAIESEPVAIETESETVVTEPNTAEAAPVQFETTDSIFDEAEKKDNVEFDSPDTLFEEHFDTTETILSDSDNVSEVTEAPAEEKPVQEEKEETNELEDVFSEAASEAFDEVDTNIEPVVEETPVFEETSVPEQEIQAASAPEEIPAEDNEVPTVEKVISQSNETANIDSNFAEVDNLDTNISKDNIDYLKSDKEAENETSSSSNSNEDLKRDIKSVLLYMDQLLENLPEEKIMEFAKSDEFVTYKKLFSDLGLS